MPQELPGFYYDAEKNRYFPIKGPIPGSSRASSSSSSRAQKGFTEQTKVISSCRRACVRTSKLLQARELCGNIVYSITGKCNFKEEVQKTQVSQPKVWKYSGTQNICDCALEQMRVNVQMVEGQTERDILLTGGINGLFSFIEVPKAQEQFGYTIQCVPTCVWPIIKGNQTGCSGVPGHVWRDRRASIQMSSNISCVKLFSKSSASAIDDGWSKHALISTLGSESHGGSLCVLNFVDPIEVNPNIPLQSIQEVATFQCTIWTVDCGSNDNQAVIGSNLGAALVDMETRRASWVLRSKSDVLSLQSVRSGNVVLCGLRNGAIVTVDVRERREGSSARLVRHRISHLASDNTIGKSSKGSFKISGNIHTSRTVKLPSSISSLVSLQYDDQYFLASSMDGSVKLYDHRLTQRGAVQSYEGHVNSHTRIQLGVDPFEKFVMSGGEDNNLRIWSIKSGELLFQDKFSNKVLSTVCWQRAENFKPYIQLNDEEKERRSFYECFGDESCSSGAWLGSQEGLFYMNWP
ncbi:hypothetical protein UlMin_019706 [Ulmus minor]